MCAHRLGLWLLATAIAIGGCDTATFAGSCPPPPPGQEPATADTAVKTLQVRPAIYLLTSCGENVTVQTGPDGTIVVDAGPKSNSDGLLAAVRRISQAPIRYLINTSASADRVGGNGTLADAGDALTGVLGTAAPIIARQNVLLSLTNTASTGIAIYYPESALPSLTFTGTQKNLRLNGEGIEVIAEPTAHSNGDSVVLFRGSDVVVAGDILDLNHFPTIDVGHGGTVQGEIAALDHLLDLAIPGSPVIWEGSGTLVIPGRGRIGDQEEVVQYRDMLALMRDRIQALIAHGKSLREVESADPTAGYDTRFGAVSGPWTTADFVEAVYRSLTGAKRVAR